MVYGISYCPLQNADILKTLNCDDSKELTEEKRNVIFNNINTEPNAKNQIGWSVEIISPNIISTSMLRRTKHSLNEISMNSAIGLIEKAIEMEVNIAEIYVDTVGPPEKYQDKLSKIFPDFNIIVEKKADSTYPIVSAASICAKVIRDHALKYWQFPEGHNLTHTQFGSGYPGDPVTKSFLRENIDPVFGYPRLVRFSWSTSVNALADGHANQMEFNNDDENCDESTVVVPTTPSIKTFFKSTGGVAGGTKHIQHRFFKDRYLSNDIQF